MKITPWIAFALLVALLMPACGLITGRTFSHWYGGDTSDLLLPAPKEGDTRVWTEATLTSVETGEQTTVAVDPPVEPGAPHHLANVAEGYWHVELVGVDLRTGESIRYSLQDVYVEGDPFVLDIESW